MKRGLFLGTFQPYMHQHRAVLEQIGQNVDELIVGITGAQISHELYAPFTAGERVQMVSADLRDFEIPVYVLPIEDIKRSPLLVSHIVSLVPEFSVVYSADSLVRRLFREAGYIVNSPDIDDSTLQEIWCRLALDSENWDELIPESTKAVIRGHDGISRMKKIAETDY